MRIFNYSGKDVNRHLWHFLARELRIDGTIRDASLLDRRELTVVVKPRALVLDSHYYGSYYPGRIDILTCPDCTPGTILHTFLHEALHAYLYELGDDYYAAVDETVIDHWATTIFKSCGGMLIGASGCSRFLLADLVAWKWKKKALLQCVQQCKADIVRRGTTRHRASGVS